MHLMIFQTDSCKKSATPPVIRSPGQGQHHMQGIFDICKAYGKSVGIFCDNTAQAEAYRAMGANFLWMCTDDQLVRAGLRAIIAPLANGT